MNIKDLINKLDAIESSTNVAEAKAKTIGNIVRKVAARPNNPNAAFAELPGAAKPATDLTGGAGITGAGEVGARRAQVAADNQLAAQRAASAQNAQTIQAALRPGEKAAATTATTAASTASKVAGSFKEKGALLGNYIKSNPKLAAAVAAAAAIYAGGKALEPNTPTPAPAPNPNPAPAPHADQGALTAEMDGLKKQIDALIAELEPSKDQAVQKELTRIKAKYSGVEQGGLPAQSNVANAFDIKKGQ